MGDKSTRRSLFGRVGAAVAVLTGSSVAVAEPPTHRIVVEYIEPPNGSDVIDPTETVEPSLATRDMEELGTHES